MANLITTALAAGALALASPPPGNSTPVDPPRQVTLDDDIVACIGAAEFLEMATALAAGNTLLFYVLYQQNMDTDECVLIKAGTEAAIVAEQDTGRGPLVCLARDRQLGCYWTNL